MPEHVLRNTKRFWVISVFDLKKYSTSTNMRAIESNLICLAGGCGAQEDSGILKFHSSERQTNYNRQFSCYEASSKCKSIQRSAIYVLHSAQK